MSEPRRVSDAELLAQLRRRSSDEPAYSEQWRSDFVLGVGDKIDSGAPSVMNRRLPAFAGLAAAVAIILIVVIAMPGFGPVGGSPSPTPGVPPVSAMTARDFASGLASGELDGDTVLVTARILPYDGPALYGATCSVEREQPVQPNFTCTLGRLDGIDPPVYVEASYAATPSGDAPFFPGAPYVWAAPQPPIEGVLALSVDEFRRVTFLGRDPGDRLTSSLPEVSALALESVALDETRVVSAWLTGIVAPISCGPPDPGTYLADLPGRYCSNPSWLAPDPVAVDPNGYRIPDGWLQVQSNAYLDFALDPSGANGSAEPRAGLYVIAKRLEGSGCPNNAPPCWQWEIVGRLTDVQQAPTPTINPLPTAAPSASPHPGPTERPRAAASVGCGRMTTGFDPPSGVPITIIDLTGLVDNCISWSPPVEGPPLVIDTGIVGDDVFSISWLGTLCETEAAVTFAESGERFALTVHQPPVSCADGPTRHALMLTFSEAIPGELIDVSVSESGPDLPTPEPRPEPTINVQPLREQANQALARWADAVAEAGGHGIVFIQGTTDQIGTWERDVGQNNKSALYAGLIEAQVDLEPAPPSPGEVRWPDGTVTPVDLLSAGDALLYLSEHATSQCTRCQPLQVTGARLTTANFETNRGTTRVPVWKYTIAGTDVMVIQVAVANAISLIPPPWDPYNTPAGASIVSARGVPESRELLFSTVDGVPPSDPARCTDYTTEAVESDLAVVVMITGYVQGDTSDSGCGVVALGSPLGDRTVLEVTEGLPVLVRPR